MSDKPDSDQGLRDRIAELEDRLATLAAAESQYRQLVESVPDIIIQIDKGGIINYCSPSAEAISGWSPEEVIGKAVFEMVHEDDIEPVKAVLQDQPSETVPPSEYRVRSKSGEYRWFRVHSQPILENGEVAGYRSVMSDVTDHRAAQEAMKESEAKYRAIFENLHDTYFRTDPDDTIILASPSGEMIFGYKVDEAVGLNLRDFYVDLNRREEALALLAKDGCLREFEAQLRRKDGSIIWVSTNATVWFDREGNVGGIEGITRDITERKLAEQEKALLEEKLRQAQKMEAIGTLAGGIAHDFNNLLTSIMGCTSMLRLILGEDHKGYSAVDVIERASKRASDLTKQLLGFARRGKLQHVPVDMHGVIGDNVAILGRAIDRKITINQELCPVSPVVMGDPSQLQQVVMNLAVNARDAMPDGGSITIGTAVEELDAERCNMHPGTSPGQHLALSVSDTGEGIPEEIRDRIFEPFFTTKPSGVGTGMGLATVYGIVKNHGGYISYDTERGNGTRFDVYLPVSDVVAAEEQKDMIHLPGSGTGRVLVVDDEPTVRETVAMMLDMLGYDVVEASDGTEAVDYFKDNSAETRLVILDMTMPKMNGSECFRRMKEIDPEVRVLISTGHAIDGAAQEILDAGVAGLVQKPFVAPELAEAVANAMQ